MFEFDFKEVEVSYSILFVFVSFIFGIFFKISGDEKDQVRIFVFLEDNPWWRKYADSLDMLSGFASRIFGVKVFGWRALNVCLILAFVYPYAIVYCWSLLYIFVVEQNLSISYFLAVIFPATIFPLVKLTNTLENLYRDINIKDIKFELVSLSQKFLLLLAIFAAFVAWVYMASYLFATITVSAFIGPVTFLTEQTITYFRIILIGLMLSLFGLNSVTVIVAICVISVALAYLQSEYIPLFLVFLPIYVGVPAANALADWLSWGASRWLIRRIKSDAERGAWLALAMHFLTDVFIAVACLALLLIALAIAFAMTGLGLTSGIDSLQFFRFAVTDPWGRGFWFTAMLATTLLPTVVHSSAAVGALILVPPPLRKVAQSFLNDTNLSFVDRTVVAAFLTVWFCLALGSACGAIYALIWGLSFDGISLLGLSFEVAERVLHVVSR